MVGFFIVFYFRIIIVKFIVNWKFINLIIMDVIEVYVKFFGKKIIIFLINFLGKYEFLYIG